MTDSMAMNDDDLLRYSRQILVADFDVAGQQRLLQSKVLIVGMGGLGSPVALYLAAAGVGELWLADGDDVETSNLQRQIAHGEADVGRPKAASAADRVRALNAACVINTIHERLQPPLLDDAIAAVDLVVDCCDNFSTRFALNAACWRARKPLVSGAAIRAEGQLLVIDPRVADSPCYRCLYDDSLGDEMLTCSTNGVLAPLVGIIGSLQALEAMKVLAGYGEASVGRLQLFDARRLEWRTLALKRDPGCPVCG